MNEKEKLRMDLLIPKGCGLALLNFIGWAAVGACFLRALELIGIISR